MADKWSKEKRSEVMSRIRSVNTRPELIIRRFLFAQGFRYRLHDKSLPGKPDIKLTKLKTVIRVNGCFWHFHEICHSYQMPKTNKRFWTKKIEQNKQRDINNGLKIEDLGWRIITIWECELKPKERQKTLDNLLNRLREKTN